MNKIDLYKAPMQAINNRQSLKGIVGCYHCSQTFDSSKIENWTDNKQTALCPKCNIDCVLPINDKILLNKIKEYWFKK